MLIVLNKSSNLQNTCYFTKFITTLSYNDIATKDDKKDKTETQTIAIIQKNKRFI